MTSIPRFSFLIQRTLKNNFSVFVYYNIKEAVATRQPLFYRTANRSLKEVICKTFLVRMQSKRKNKGSDIRTRFASKAKEIEEIGSALQKT